MRNTEWSSKEVSILKKYYSLEGSEISKRLPGRTSAAILRKAAYLKLVFQGTTTSGQTPWTDLEIQVLKENYPLYGPSGMVARNLLAGRNRAMINNKAASLRLKYNKPQAKDAEEKKLIAFLRREPKTILEVAEYLDRSPTSVERIVAELKEKHFNIQVLDDGQQVTLTPDPASGGHEVINVEKYFGSSREVVFGIISDLHYGNVHCREELIQLQYEIFKKEGVPLVFECGNMIDGEIYFNRYELIAHGVTGQINYLIEKAPKVEGITTYFVTGDDHEGWMAHNMGLNIGQLIEHEFRRVGRQDWVYLGFMEADVQFKTRDGGSCVRLAHPGGGTAYALSYTLQKIIESLQGGEKPHVYLSGHYHKLGYWMIRNVHTMLVGCMEDQTTFMRKKHIEAQLGAWIVRMTLSPNGTILKFQPQAFPYFDRKLYTTGADFNMPALEVAEPKKKKQRPSRIF